MRPTTATHDNVFDFGPVACSTREGLPHLSDCPDRLSRLPKGYSCGLLHLD